MASNPPCAFRNVGEIANFAADHGVADGESETFSLEIVKGPHENRVERLVEHSEVARLGAVELVAEHRL